VQSFPRNEPEPASLRSQQAIGSRLRTQQQADAIGSRNPHLLAE
jgi:hypothetical protein